MSALPIPAASTEAASHRHGALLHALPHIAQTHADAQIEKFRYQLADALLKLSETSNRPAEEQAAFHAYNHLRNHGAKFCKSLSSAISTLTAAALRNLEKGRTEPSVITAAAESFEDMEDRMLEDEIRYSLEQHVGTALEALNLRIAELLGRERVDTELNPWRPLLFVQAIRQAWTGIDADRAARRVMLSRLGPQLFFRLDAIYSALNASLVENSILPDIKAVARQRKRGKSPMPAMPFASTTSPILMARGERYNRVRDWLLSGGGKPSQPEESGHLNLPDLFGTPDAAGNWQANTISVAVGPRLFSHLTRLQKQLDAGIGERQAPVSATVLRHIRAGLPEGNLTAVDENTIELLARIFDQLLASPDIAPPIRKLLARLQIPMLKAALMDRKFFINATHPARRLLDQLVACSVGCDPAGAPTAAADSLLHVLSRMVDRVTAEFDQNTALLAELTAWLDTCLADEDRSAEALLTAAIAPALRAERAHLAELAARADINQRLESGAVPQFVEVFLETQWVRILTIGHSVRHKKPEVLERALKAMDELIATLQPPVSAERRKALLECLPITIANVNAWLDAIKWHGPERGRFFAMLAERHAAQMRLYSDGGNPRVEAAVAMAHRASERNLARERRKKAMAADSQHAHAANLCHGDWLELSDPDGSRQRVRLAWISPARSQYIFADRQAGTTTLWSESKLDHALKTGAARTIALDRAVDRALDAILNPG